MVKRLINGFGNFRRNFFSSGKAVYSDLAKNGQKPSTMIISCSDSRVDPATLFGTQPGELFVVRNVANLIPPYQPKEGYQGVSAAIEYGVLDLRVSEIIILGHSLCGGIQALCSSFLGDYNEEREFIKPWIKIAEPALDRLGDSLNSANMARAAEQASIINSMKNLRTFPWIQSAELNNKLLVHGWWFDMEAGNLWAVENEEGKFYQILST